MKSQGVNLRKDQIPVATTIFRNALTDVYMAMRNDVKKMIGASSAAITFDTWTDNFRRRGYITITYHEIVDFELRKYTLSTRMLSGSHTAINIKDEIQSVLDSFEVKATKIWAVTDAGSNVIKASKLAGMESHKCLGHGLHNLIIADGIKNIDRIKNLVEKLKSIVSAIRYKAAKLEEIQLAESNARNNQSVIEIGIIEDEIYDEVIEIDLESDLESDEDEVETGAENSDEVETGAENSDEVEVPSNVRGKPITSTIKTQSPTRWHSLLMMLESIMKAKSSVVQLLSEMDSEITILNKDWTLMDELITLLSKFRDTVKILSQDKNCTINTALLLYCDLKSVLEEVVEKESSCIKEMKRKMLSKLDIRFPKSNVMILAALLDPHLKQLDAIDDYILFSTSFKNKQDFLFGMYTDLCPNNTSISLEPVTISTHPKETNVKNVDVISKIEELVNKHSQRNVANSFKNVFENECTLYIGMENPAKYDILQFWKDRSSLFPNLSKLVTQVFCIPATSTPSERVFNVAGDVVDKRRSNLRSHNVNKIIYIHDNYAACMKSCENINTYVSSRIDNTDKSDENNENMEDSDSDIVDEDGL